MWCNTIHKGVGIIKEVKMKIKGHSIIELTDVKTGKKEVYEDDNMVTNALQLYLNDLGMFNISPIHMAGVRESLIPSLLGGLLVLDTALTESASNIICPSGVKMVGNGAYGVTSNDTVTEMGSYNSSESGWMSDGKYKQVWDFTTTQAHGNINCVCLTSANHGYIGEGNATSGEQKSTLRNDYALGGTPQAVGVDGGRNIRSRVVRGSWTNSTITMIDEYNLIPTAGHTEEHMSATGKVKLKTYQVPLSKLDLRNNYPAYAAGSGSEYIPVTETEITLPAAFKNALNGGAPSWYLKQGEYYYMIAGFGLTDYGQGAWGRFASGATWQVVRINPDNTISEFTVTNPAGEQFDFFLQGLAFSENTILIQRHTNNNIDFVHYFEDITTNADITAVTTTFGCRILGFCYPTEEVAYFTGMKADMGARTVYLTNGNKPGYNMTPQILDDNKLVSAVLESSYAEGFNMVKTTNYLATIDNLAEQITKTAEKTMKITYVLAFEEEEEE